MMMTTSIVPIAQKIDGRLLSRVASAMYEPTPGSAMEVAPTLIASEATTKNQAPDIDIIMFQMSCGIANGTSRRQKRIQGVRWKLRAASSSSVGTVRSD